MFLSGKYEGVQGTPPPEVLTVSLPALSESVSYGRVPWGNAESGIYVVRAVAVGEIL